MIVQNARQSGTNNLWVFFEILFRKNYSGNDFIFNFVNLNVVLKNYWEITKHIGLILF